MTEKMTICTGYGKETFSIAQINIYLAVQNYLHRKYDVQWHPLQLSQMHLKYSKNKQRFVFLSHWSYLGAEVLNDGTHCFRHPIPPRQAFRDCFMCRWKAKMCSRCGFLHLQCLSVWVVIVLIDILTWHADRKQGTKHA